MRTVNDGSELRARMLLTFTRYRRRIWLTAVIE